MKKIIILLLGISYNCFATEIWERTDVLDEASGKINLKYFLEPSEESNFTNKCLNDLKSQSKNYESKCDINYGQYIEQSGVKTSLIGSHVYCALTCVDPSIDVGSCRIERLHDSSGGEKRLFLVLRTQSQKSIGYRLFIEHESSLIGALKALQTRALNSDECN